MRSTSFRFRKNCSKCTFCNNIYWCDKYKILLPYESASFQVWHCPYLSCNPNMYIWFQDDHSHCSRSAEYFLVHWFHIHDRNTVFIPGERASEVLVLRLNMYKNCIWQWDPRLTTFPRNLPRVVSEGSSSGCQHPCLWPLLPTQVMSEKIPRAPHINPVNVVSSLLPISLCLQAPWGKTSAFRIFSRVFTFPCLPLSAIKSHVRRVHSHVTKCHEKASFMRSQLGVLHSFPEWGWSFRYLTYLKTALLILLFQQKE